MECENFSPNKSGSNGLDNVRTSLPLFNNQNFNNINTNSNFSLFNQQNNSCNNNNSNGFFNNTFTFGSIQSSNQQQQQQQQQPSLFGGQSTGFNFSFAPTTLFQPSENQQTQQTQQTGLFGQNLGFMKNNNDEDPEDPEFRPDEVAESDSDDDGADDEVEPEEGKISFVEL